jgi:hypothetical protein
VRARGFVLIALVAGGLVMSSGVATATGALTLSDVSIGQLRTSNGRVSDRVIVRPSRSLAASLARSAWGGTYTTSTGEHVSVFASDSYVVDSAALQSVAEFVTRLVHGPEISTVTIYLAPLQEVEAVCQAEAVGCYFPSTRQLVVIGNDVPGYSVVTVLAHELGHHIAANRSNDPWPAVEWGPKDWASYENVCSRTQSGLSFPGDEGAHYTQNPGEAFAESYMYLNMQRLGATVPPWEFDPLFFPDYGALSSISSDVLQPWRGLKHFSWRGRVAPGHAVSSTLPTKLDGTIALRLSAPRGSLLLIYANDQLAATTRSRFDATICGVRSVVTKLVARRTGRFAVNIWIP